MTLRIWALSLAVVLAASSGAAACDWNKNMTMASVPVVEKTVTVANVPVDLWLIPYLS